jgi:hypothetical protein
MKQVQIFHALCDRLSPEHIHKRGKFCLLPGENIIVCLRRHNPKRSFRPSSKDQLCYLVKNILKVGLVCKNITLHKLLLSYGIQYKMITFSTNSLRMLHKKWLRGYKVWYKLRKYFILSNMANKKLQPI